MCMEAFHAWAPRIADARAVIAISGTLREPEVLVRTALAGDQEAFAQIVRAFDRDVLRVCFLVCQDSEMARDAAQAAWQMAWRRLRTLRDPAKVRAWILVLAANEARQAVRRDRRRRFLVRPLEDAHTAEMQDHDRLIDLARALHRLPPEDRALVVLRYFAGFDSSELAEQLGGSASGIRGRLHRLLVRLRKELDDG